MRRTEIDAKVNAIADTLKYLVEAQKFKVKEWQDMVKPKCKNVEKEQNKMLQLAKTRLTNLQAALKIINEEVTK